MAIINTPNISIYSFNFNSLLSILSRVAFILLFCCTLILPFVVGFGGVYEFYFFSFVDLFFIVFFVFFLYSFSHIIFTPVVDLVRFFFFFVFLLLF